MRSSLAIRPAAKLASSCVAVCRNAIIKSILDAIWKRILQVGAATAPWTLNAAAAVLTAGSTSWPNNSQSTWAFARLQVIRIASSHQCHSVCKISDWYGSSRAAEQTACCQELNAMCCSNAQAYKVTNVQQLHYYMIQLSKATDSQIVYIAACNRLKFFPRPSPQERAKCQVDKPVMQTRRQNQKRPAGKEAGHAHHMPLSQ